jgi:hypothetical protein
MKIRAGFVSNSSSSSYICEVCGDTFEAWDEGISRFHLVQCNQDHLFCECHRINPNPDGTYIMYEEEGEDNQIDSIHCPICQMQEITNDMVLTYLIHKSGMKFNEVKDEMKKSFETFEEFQSYICGYEPEFGIELTYHTRIKAVNEEEAHKKARDEAAKYPIKMDVTHCEKL